LRQESRRTGKDHLRITIN